VAPPAQWPRHAGRRMCTRTVSFFSKVSSWFLPWFLHGFLHGFLGKWSQPAVKPRWLLSKIRSTVASTIGIPTIASLDVFNGTKSYYYSTLLSTALRVVVAG
jgi:hypothetical protein